jgi:hypothetical protein
MKMAKKFYKSMDSLVPVTKVINEAAEALNNPGRTIASSAIPDILGAALGASLGGAASFAALTSLGVAGLSAAGITSGLAAAGAIVGGGMVAGIGVLAAPVAILGVAGYALINGAKHKKLRQEKERLYQLALQRHDALINMLKGDVNKSKEREEYLQGLVFALKQVISGLQSDLAK